MHSALTKAIVPSISKPPHTITVLPPSIWFENLFLFKEYMPEVSKTIWSIQIKFLHTGKDNFTFSLWRTPLYYELLEEVVVRNFFVMNLTPFSKTQTIQVLHHTSLISIEVCFLEQDPLILMSRKETENGLLVCICWELKITLNLFSFVTIWHAVSHEFLNATTFLFTKSKGLVPCSMNQKIEYFIYIVWECRAE